jgi:quercetin dioxygenase-like cupin family protein
MKIDGVSLVTNVNTPDAIPFPIPGATPDGVKATLVNVDGAKGLVTTIIHIAPGARIPAHYHNDGAEAHFVLEGDFINAGVSHGPGTFVTHPAGVVHGPDESKSGCKILTLQTACVDPAKPDFNIAG